MHPQCEELVRPLGEKDGRPVDKQSGARLLGEHKHYLDGWVIQLSPEHLGALPVCWSPQQEQTFCGPHDIPCSGPHKSTAPNQRHQRPPWRSFPKVPQQQGHSYQVGRGPLSARTPCITSTRCHVWHTCYAASIPWLVPVTKTALCLHASWNVKLCLLLFQFFISADYSQRT